MIRSLSPSPMAPAITPMKTSVVSEFNIFQEKSPKDNIITNNQNYLNSVPNARQSIRGTSSGPVNAGLYSSVGALSVEGKENQMKSQIKGLERELNREQEKNIELSKKVKEYEKIFDENKISMASSDVEGRSTSSSQGQYQTSSFIEAPNRDTQRLRDANEEQERKIRNLLQENFKISSELAMKNKDLEKFRMKEFSENKALQDCEYKIMRLSKENEDMGVKINTLRLEVDLWRKKLSEENQKSQEVTDKLEVEREMAKKMKIDLESKLQILLKENERLHIVMRERIGEVKMESKSKFAMVSNDFTQLDNELKERIAQTKVLKKK
jgi:chromosome segregation ATPase